MKRQNAFITKYGCVLTLMFLCALSLSVWYGGGKAFSPGALSAKQRVASTRQGYESHADFEEHCGLCHAPFEMTQDKLCLACHEDIDQQMTMENGTHHLIEGINRCASCHPDHRGREFDPTRNAYPFFDHSRTKFSLAWHQVNFDARPIACTDCHAVESDFSVSNAECEACHSGQDPEFISQHIQESHQNCLICHDGADRMTNLDHQSTAFPLDGQHVNISCVECHNVTDSAQHQGVGYALISNPVDSGELADDPFTSTPRECAQCHKEPEEHKGLFVGACSECHTTSGWMPPMLEGVPFEHAGLTGFSLVRHSRGYQNQPMVCLDCHQSALNDFDLQTCIACHSGGEDRAAFILRHRGQFGDTCLECHDGADLMSDFNHNRFFPLEGSHGNLECVSCHQSKKFVGTVSDCVQCHIEPAIHAGFFGVQCRYCHTAQAWTPAQLRTHRFPLDHGGQGEIECQVCHPGNYSEITCYGCHDHQPDPIAASHAQVRVVLDQLANCTNCHPDGIIDVKE